MASPGFSNINVPVEYLRAQLEIQGKIHDQLEVQRQLQLRIEAQGRYLKRLYDKMMNEERHLLKASASDSHHDSKRFPVIRSKI